MSSLEQQRFDIAPIGLNPWVPFKLNDTDPKEKPQSEYMRGLEMLDELYPAPRKPLDDLVHLTLMSILRAQCSRNTVDKEQTVTEDDLWVRVSMGKAAPHEVLSLHNREPAVRTAEIGRLTHGFDGWEGVDYIDRKVTADIYGHDELDSRQVYGNVASVKLKQFSGVGQMIGIKHLVATHFGGESLSKRRHVISVNLVHPQIDKELKDAILTEQYENQINLNRHSDVVGALVLPYLAEVKKPDWLQPRLTAYYVMNTADQTQQSTDWDN